MAMKNTESCCQSLKVQPKLSAMRQGSSLPPSQPLRSCPLGLQLKFRLPAPQNASSKTVQVHTTTRVPSPKRCYLPGAAVDSRGSSEGAPLTLTWVKDTGTRSCAGAKHPYGSDCIPSVSAKGMARAGNFPAAGTARVVHRYSVVRSVVLDVRRARHVEAWNPIPQESSSGWLVDWATSWEVELVVEIVLAREAEEQTGQKEEHEKHEDEMRT